MSLVDSLAQRINRFTGLPAIFADGAATAVAIGAFAELRRAPRPSHGTCAFAGAALMVSGIWLAARGAYTPVWEPVREWRRKQAERAAARREWDD